MPLPKLSLAVLDTETTGFVPRVHHVMEFACMRVENGKVVEEYEELLSVPDEIPPHVQMLTRIFPKDIAGKPSIKDRTKEIMKSIGEDTIIVGQNIGFDIGMLKGEGIDLSDRPCFDTSMLAALVFPELASYSLGYMSQVLGLNHEPKHRALGDVRATLEMLEKCWDRITNLPQKELDQLRDVFSRSTPAYQALAKALPKKGGDTLPLMPGPVDCTDSKKAFSLPVPKSGAVALQEESLDPSFLPGIIRAAIDDTSTRHWIAVKNLEATARRCLLPEDVSVVFPPFLLPDDKAIAKLEAQKELSADEATLLLKILWLKPQTRADIAVHGGEKELWGGRVAATEAGKSYLDQFAKLSGVVLIDQRQLLQCIREQTPEIKKALSGKTHIVIDDASMLEETATKAFGDVCPLQELRAAAEQNPALVKLADMMALWVEQVRQNQDMRFLAVSDLEKSETKMLREQLTKALEGDIPSSQAKRLFRSAIAILDPKHLAGHVTWIEVWQNGSVVLQSFPERIDLLLKEHLFDAFPTTLLVPRGCNAMPLVVPQKTPVESAPLDPETAFSVSFPEGRTVSDVLNDPPDGKTVILLGSRKAIEQCYVKYVEPLEQRGVTLLCQGLSGSTGRMEAEFVAAEGQAVCVLTPWTYEGFELPAETVSHLVLDQVPFDSPSQPMIQARSKFLQDAFNDYLLPKLYYRLFRLLRTLRRQAKDGTEIEVFDERLRTKQYGGKVMAYLSQFSTDEKNVLKTDSSKKKNRPSLF